MNNKKLGLFALTFFFGAIILLPALTAVSASAQCSICDQGCGTYVRDCDRCVYEGDLLRCNSCDIRDYDRTAARDCDHCASEYRCDLYGCTWIR